MQNDFLPYLKTKDDAERLLEEVDLLLEVLYEGGRAFNDSLKGKVRAKIASTLSDTFATDGDREKVLRDLKGFIESLPLVKLSIAIEPRTSTIDKIYSRLQNLLGNVLLEITFDPKLIGGVVISYKGEYRDFSLLRFFDLEFKEKSS